MSEICGLLDYWDSLKPEKCKKCECAELDFTREGSPFWACTVEECYKDVLKAEDQKDEVS